MVISEKGDGPGALDAYRRGLAIRETIAIAEVMLSARKNTQATATDRNVRANAAIFAGPASRRGMLGPYLFQA